MQLNFVADLVHETTRFAWITLLLSLSFLLVSLGVFLLVGALGQLFTGVGVVSGILFSSTLHLISNLWTGLLWLGPWNGVMISYVVIIEGTGHIQRCRCPYTPLKNGGRLPLCGKIWLACLLLLGLQVVHKCVWQLFGVLLY